MFDFKEYDDNSIDALFGADQVRARPAAILGSKGLDGARHTFYEIVGNATDEKISGFGDKLYIKLYKDGSVSVRDFGRGVPLGYNSKLKKWNYYLIYEFLYSGGKFKDKQRQELLSSIEKNNAWDKFDFKDYPYLISVGLNGLGAAATQCSSEYTNVKSYRDGKVSSMDYRDGKHVLDELLVEDTDEADGTFVHWKPDRRVFSDVNINKDDWVLNVSKTLSYVSGFEVHIEDENTGKKEVYPARTIKDYLEDYCIDVIQKEVNGHIKDDDNEWVVFNANISIGTGKGIKEYYHNFIKVSNVIGAHESGVTYALERFFKMIGNQYGVRINMSDYSNEFSFVISTLASKSSSRGQTKDYIDDYFITNCISEGIVDMLMTEYNKGTSWLADIIDRVIEKAQNRALVAKLSKDVREVEKKIKKTKLSEKFKASKSYIEGRAEETELWIVEGDSAAGLCTQARDPEFQCISPIRGKSLNVYKAKVTSILANKEICNIAVSLGAGIDMGKDSVSLFEMQKLKVGKVIFSSDADDDGYHIRILLFLIFYKLFPEMLYEGKVYIANVPKYCIVLNNGQQVFCTTNEDRDAKVEELGQSSIKRIERFKGLGQMNPEQLWETSMNPKTRNLTQIKIDPNDKDLEYVLEALFGQSTDTRKRAILGSMLGVNYDEFKDNMESMLKEIDSTVDDGLDYEEFEYSI